MGLACTNYVCICCEDASVRMPSHVLVGCLVQSQGVFAIGQNIESRGTRMGVYVGVCGCIRSHTRTYTCGLFGCEPMGRDQTPGRPEKSRSTTSRHICSSFVYVYKVHTCMYFLGSGMRSRTDCFFL